MSVSDKNKNKEIKNTKTKPAFKPTKKASPSKAVSSLESEHLKIVKPYFYVSQNSVEKKLIHEQVSAFEDIKSNHGGAHFYSHNALSVNLPVNTVPEKTVAVSRKNEPVVSKCDDGSFPAIESAKHTEPTPQHDIKEVLISDGAISTENKNVSSGSISEYLGTKKVAHSNESNDMKSLVGVASSAKTEHPQAETIHDMLEKSDIEDSVKNKQVVKNQPSVKFSNTSILSSLRAEDIKLSPNADKYHRKKTDLVRHIIMAVLVAVMAVSAVNIVFQTVSKSRESDYYSEIRDSFYSDDFAYSSAGYLEKDSGSEPDTQLYSTDGVLLQASQSDNELRSEYSEMFPKLEALRQLNADVFAWIKVDDTRVDYPVVRSPQGNNDYYLNHGPNHKYSSSGAIFADYNNSMDLSENRNTCIYGHNMNNGTMFQTIMNYKSQERMLNGAIRVYTAGGIYVYSPFAVYEAEPTESFFRVDLKNDSIYEWFLQDICSKSMFEVPVELDIDDKIITLVTCTNTWRNKRFVVHGVLKEIIK